MKAHRNLAARNPALDLLGVQRAVGAAHPDARADHRSCALLILGVGDPRQRPVALELTPPRRVGDLGADGGGGAWNKLATPKDMRE